VFSTIALMGSLMVVGTPPSDPLRFRTNLARMKNAKEIIKYAVENGEDPYQLLAIAITESGLNEKAFSRTKDSGLMQVNCRWWWKSLKFKNIKKCRVTMMDNRANIHAGVHILRYFKKNFKQCKGDKVYLCYNGGQRWRNSKNINKIIYYSGKVRWRKNILEKHYSGLVNFTMLLL